MFEKNRLINYIRIARFDHWIKQFFIFPGVWLASVMIDTEKLSPTKILFTSGFGLLATGFAASANYCINEYLDAEFDKFHPVKKTRPCVSENMSGWAVSAEYLLFAIAAAAVSFQISKAVMWSEILLLIFGLLYNVRPIRTKDLPFVDVLSESLNNAIRLAIGWFCVTNMYLPPVSVIFGYWMGGAFLMAAKRLAEYRMIGDREQAGLYRKSFRYYSEISLLMSTVFYGLMSVFFCGIFLIKYRVELLLFIPFLCGLFCYYIKLCYENDSAAQKPEKLFREKKLMAYVAFLITLFVALNYIRLPIFDIFVRFDLVRIP